ncbi:MspA family porin [Mycolicibacterium goodii]|uniref:MspA family porin n=1 Tax=Mycolicibacterium goodii TaxID=134601 RepID=UPI001BDC11D4|nr:MspA family porin [Mycolicibacterium goodii]MBU8829760.1 MspA family porin [Mycolicibacterium goodii]
MKAAAALFVTMLTVPSPVLTTPGSADATMNSELSVVDGRGRVLTVQLWDTQLETTAPLDRNRLTREWYQTGRARYVVSGAEVDTFRGLLELGYQIGFPWSMGVRVTFNYTTPNLLVYDGSIAPPPLGAGFAPLEAVLTPDLLPGVTFSSDLGKGPGIQEVVTSSIPVTKPRGGIGVVNAHGTVTGAAGGVLLRPFARLSSSQGDSVTAYDSPWNIG